MKQFRPPVAKRVLAAGLAAALSLTIAGCGGNDGKQSSSPLGQVDPNDKCTADKVDPNSTLTVSTFLPTQTLDPAKVPGGYAGGTEATAIYDTLMRYNPATGAFDPFVAESLNSNADSTKWTLKLRPGIKFGNGDALTAKDVAYSVNRMKAAKVAAAASANFVGSMDVVDDATIVFHLVKPWGGFPAALAAESGMVVNQKVVESLGAAFGSNPVGAGVGPYEPVKLSPGEATTMKAKTNYWGGPVCVGNLKFVSVPGDQAAYEAFQKREVDVVSLQDPVVVHDFEQTGHVKEVSGIISGWGMGLNNRPDSPFSDIRLRQAVAMAIDPNVVNQRAFGGQAIMASGLTAPGMRIDSGVAGPKYDPDKAKQLVAAAKADGVNTNVDLLCPDTFNQDYILAVQALLNQVGLNVKTSIASAVDHLAKLQAGSFQITCGATQARDDSPLRQLSQMTSNSAVNRYGFANPDLDAAINNLYLAKDENEVKAAMAKVQEVWNRVVPMALLYAVKQIAGFHDDVRGMYLGEGGTLGFDKVYIAK